MGKLVIMSGFTPPPKITNCQKRSREHLFPREVGAMVKAAKRIGRHGLRDSTLILMAYRHGLRVSELVTLRWEQIDFASGTIYINRLKHGLVQISYLLKNVLTISITSRETSCTRQQDLQLNTNCCKRFWLFNSIAILFEL